MSKNVINQRSINQGQIFIRCNIQTKENQNAKNIFKNNHKLLQVNSWLLYVIALWKKCNDSICAPFALFNCNFREKKKIRTQSGNAPTCKTTQTKQVKSEL